MRPADLASDTAGSLDVLRHAIGQCPGFDWVLLLQPTSPLRSAQDIDAAWQMTSAAAPSCVSVTEVAESPWLMHLRDDAGRLSRLLPERETGMRRQDLPAVFRLNGALYLARTDWFLAGGRLVGSETLGYVMPPERSVDIDTQADFDVAERWLAEGSRP